MRVLVLGGDGYLGWPTALAFASRGDEVWLVDNYAKRKWEALEGIGPLLPVPLLPARISAAETSLGMRLRYSIGDIAANYRFLLSTLEAFKPHAIIHYAEQPSAPYSMKGHEAALDTQVNNVSGTLNLMFAVKATCPDAHIIKLGTMGEYGTPNVPIEEGWIDIESDGRSDRMLFPKRPGSFYHLSKVHDSHNLEFGSRIWGLRVTDLNQGVVYGIETALTPFGDDQFRTSFHYDAVFGTVLNRFVVQASIGMPLSIYGSGGQTRGFLNIEDTIKCVQLVADDPPPASTFRVFNQFTEQFSVSQLAELVREAGTDSGLKVDVQHIDNPRAEQEEHFYEARHSNLLDLGLTPILLTREIVGQMIEVASRNRAQIAPSSLLPSIPWNQHT